MTVDIAEALRISAGTVLQRAVMPAISRPVLAANAEGLWLGQAGDSFYSQGTSAADGRETRTEGPDGRRQRSRAGRAGPPTRDSAALAAVFAGTLWWGLGLTALDVIPSLYPPRRHRLDDASAMVDGQSPTGVTNIGQLRPPAPEGVA